MSQRKTSTKTPDKPEADRLFVVGLGASAGGVEAISTFMEHVPADSGMAYVVILHLSPDYDSQLTQILQGVTPLPVTKVTGKTQVLPNHVYVIPPDQHLQMEDDHLLVIPNTSIEERRAPVDIFFRTLAESHGGQAIAVILSGTGANGSMGIKRVKEKGGAVFVQNPREAAFSEMPRNTIATDLVDEVLPVSQIPARLLAYRQSLGTVEIKLEAQHRPEDQQQALREVFTQLRLRTGHDFSNYKRPTLLRRLERRIHVRNLPDLPAYVAFLRENVDETQALLKDLLISVTNFFRDSAVFTALEQDIIPALTRPRAQGGLRIWVAGCATGEEAYSLAMLCAERTMDVLDAPKVQIFATDIDDEAIAIAREALYTINDAADVSPERLRRFFTKEGDEYRIRREIREMVLFANHNVLKDPPFSRIDLVSCRNLLIYLNHTAQERVMETFHFALKPGGYLVLGLSETVDGSNDLYATVSREHHLYQSRQVATRSYPVPESTPLLAKEKKRSLEPIAETENRPAIRMNYGDLHQQLLEQYAPPSIIVNEEYDILHISDRAGAYLHVAGGEPSKNLLKLIRPELRLELRTAFYQAQQQQTNVDVRNLRLQQGDRLETITIHVRPVLREGDPARGFFLVIFEPVNAEPDTVENVLTSVEPVARQLEQELIRAKTQLRASNEHHELQAEELKASNEELQAMNEELRSAAEELETSKEELQSINEELTTVNQELKVKVEEVSLTSNNFQNLINSTDIATLFLDRSLRVNLFTPAARQIFNLIPSDFGRPLTDITNRLDYQQLQADAEAVLDTLQPVEREVQTGEGRLFIMRVLPYRTAEDRINGIVLTFIDITQRKVAEEALRLSQQQQAFLLALTDILRPLTNPTDIQYQACRLLCRHLKASRVDYAEVQPDSQVVVMSRQYPDGPADRYTTTVSPALLAQLQAGHTLVHDDVASDPTRASAENEAGPIRPVGTTVNVPVLKGGQLVAILFGHFQQAHNWSDDELALLEETAERTWAAVESARAEANLRESEEKYRSLFSAVNEAFALCQLIVDEAGQPVDYRMVDVNPAFTAMTGITAQAARQHSARALLPDLEPWQIERYGRVALQGETYRFESRAESIDRWYDAYAASVGPLNNGLFTLVFKDITEGKRREANAVFLADVSEVFAHLTVSDDVMKVVGEKMAAYFGTSRLTFTRVDEAADQATVLYDVHHPDLPDSLGDWRMSDLISPGFVHQFRDGRPIVVNDRQAYAHPVAPAETYLRLDEGAQLLAPMLSDGQWRFVVTLYKQEPYAWRADEIDLLEDLAPRLYLALERLQLETLKQQTLVQQTEELANVGSWEYDRQQQQFTWSAGMYRLFELAPDQPIQPALYETFAIEEDKDKARRLITYLHEGENSFNSIFRIKVGDRVKTLRIKAGVIGEGPQTRVMGVDLNISEQLEAQQQIRQTAENLQAVLDSSPAAIGLLKAVRDEASPEQVSDFRLAVGNRKLSEFFGQPLDTLLGESTSRFCELLWGDETLAILRHVHQSGEPVYREQPMPTNDRWVAISVTRQDDGVVLTGLDITGLKQIQAQNQQWLSELKESRQTTDALSELRASLQHRTELLRAVSHDLRGNFGVIAGSLQLLSIAASEAERSQMMDMALRNVKEATSMLTELLDYARLETGQEQRQLETVDVSELLQKIGQGFQPIADEQQLQLRVDGPATLTTEGDPIHIHRMVQNLVINALKYTHRGEVTLRWGDEPTQERWWCSVSDTGPGLDPELVTQLNTNSQRNAGVSVADARPAPGGETGWTALRGEGIGLRIVQQLALLLEARLQVTSQLGMGTEFVISFPKQYNNS
ncbi:CheR family methyltransferase [Fibrella aestuarina]|nr:CheR family methyltransferase [Fibrella aestuarina]